MTNGFVWTWVHHGSPNSHGFSVILIIVPPRGRQGAKVSGEAFWPFSGRNPHGGFLSHRAIPSHHPNVRFGLSINHPAIFGYPPWGAGNLHMFPWPTPAAASNAAAKELCAPSELPSLFRRSPPSWRADHLAVLTRRVACLGGNPQWSKWEESINGRTPKGWSIGLSHVKYH